MPRKPSDNVVTHRIELGVFERKFLEEKVLPTYQTKEVGETLASILQAVGSLSAGTIAAYVSLWTAWKTYPTLKDEMKESLGGLLDADNYKLVNDDGEVQLGFKWLADLLGMDYNGKGE